MAKVKLEHDGAVVCWFCPGCNRMHHVPITEASGETVLWAFNGDFQSPTIEPSLLLHAAGDNPRCHSVITAGMVSFGSDTDHTLAGQQVMLSDYQNE